MPYFIVRPHRASHARGQHWTRSLPCCAELCSHTDSRRAYQQNSIQRCIVSLHAGHTMKLHCASDNVHAMPFCRQIYFLYVMHLCFILLHSYYLLLCYSGNFNEIRRIQILIQYIYFPNNIIKQIFISCRKSLYYIRFFTRML